MSSTNVKFKLRSDTRTNWATSNTVLAAGEPGFETDTQMLKVGNGTLTWPNLPAAGMPGMVNPKSFGATGNGTTDDSVAIQAAINSLTTSGGYVFFPTGTYNIGTTTINLVQNTTYEFGLGATIQYSGNGYALRAATLQNVSIVGGRIDISRASAGAVCLGILGVWFMRVQNTVFIQGPPDSGGIFIDGSGRNTGSYIIKLIGLNMVTGAGAYKIKTVPFGDSRATHLDIEGGWIGRNSEGYGIFLDEVHTGCLKDVCLEDSQTGILFRNCADIVFQPGEVVGHYAASAHYQNNTQSYHLGDARYTITYNVATATSPGTYTFGTDAVSHNTGYIVGRTSGARARISSASVTGSSGNWTVTAILNPTRQTLLAPTTGRYISPGEIIDITGSKNASYNGSPTVATVIPQISYITTVKPPAAWVSGGIVVGKFSTASKPITGYTLTRISNTYYKVTYSFASVSGSTAFINTEPITISEATPPFFNFPRVNFNTSATDGIIIRNTGFEAVQFVADDTIPSTRMRTAAPVWQSSCPTMGSIISVRNSDYIADGEYVVISGGFGTNNNDIGLFPTINRAPGTYPGSYSAVATVTSATGIVSFPTNNTFTVSATLATILNATRTRCPHIYITSGPNLGAYTMTNVNTGTNTVTISGTFPNTSDASAPTLNYATVVTSYPTSNSLILNDVTNINASTANYNVLFAITASSSHENNGIYITLDKFVTGVGRTVTNLWSSLARLNILYPSHISERVTGGSFVTPTLTDSYLTLTTTTATTSSGLQMYHSNITTKGFDDVSTVAMSAAGGSGVSKSFLRYGETNGTVVGTDSATTTITPYGDLAPSSGDGGVLAKYGSTGSSGPQSVRYGQFLGSREQKNITFGSGGLYNFNGVLSRSSLIINAVGKARPTNSGASFNITAASGTTLTVTTTAVLCVGTQLTISSVGGFTGIDTTTTYYVASVISSTSITIATGSATGTVVSVGGSGTPANANVVANTTTVTLMTLGTLTGSSTLTITPTIGLVAGTTQLVFSSSGSFNLNVNQTYYVKTVNSTTSIVLSSESGSGADLTVSGSMANAASLLPANVGSITEFGLTTGSAENGTGAYTVGTIDTASAPGYYTIGIVMAPSTFVNSPQTLIPSAVLTYYPTWNFFQQIPIRTQDPGYGAILKANLSYSQPFTMTVLQGGQAWQILSCYVPTGTPATATRLAGNILELGTQGATTSLDSNGSMYNSLSSLQESPSTLFLSPNSVFFVSPPRVDPYSNTYVPFSGSEFSEVNKTLFIPYDNAGKNATSFALTTDTNSAPQLALTPGSAKGTLFYNYRTITPATLTASGLTVSSSTFTSSQTYSMTMYGNATPALNGVYTALATSTTAVKFLGRQFSGTLSGQRLGFYANSVAISATSATAVGAGNNLTTSSAITISSGSPSVMITGNSTPGNNGVYSVPSTQLTNSLSSFTLVNAPFINVPNLPGVLIYGGYYYPILNFPTSTTVRVLGNLSFIPTNTTFNVTAASTTTLTVSSTAGLARSMPITFSSVGGFTGISTDVPYYILSVNSTSNQISITTNPIFQTGANAVSVAGSGTAPASVAIVISGNSNSIVTPVGFPTGSASPSTSTTTISGVSFSTTTLTISGTFASVSTGFSAFSATPYNAAGTAYPNSLGTTSAPYGAVYCNQVIVSPQLASISGSTTINKVAGAVYFPESATTLDVSNSFVTPTSIILATVATNSSTFRSVSVVAGQGTFRLIANALDSANTIQVNFYVIN